VFRGEAGDGRDGIKRGDLATRVCHDRFPISRRATLDTVISIDRSFRKITWLAIEETWTEAFLIEEDLEAQSFINGSRLALF
ncbi:hypothetical protein N8618_00580, partial [bacterium]|nr:hypothetical protein [bacterium]